ncbi:MAG: DUF3015 domain-containing protein [Proteobacteria bacterium]|jgi:hypothetical protein|nr:DUF3015 domain-containing protein [Pseudomonadota bacterium]
MKKLVVTSMLLLSSVAMAKSYGDAGCGLGSVIFGNEKGFSQIFAATTNGTSGNQTFGISSGTSNCVDQGAMKGARAVPVFIEMNKAALAKDAARGQGETIANLANLLGCNSSALGQTLKSQYNNIFVETGMNPQAIEAGINSAISANKAQACGA